MLFLMFIGQAQAEVTTLMLLDRAEPHDAMTAHAGHLWVGQSRKNFNSNYAVHVYNQSNQLVGSVSLPHSVTQLSPYGKDAVIANGISPSPNLTMYSILKLSNGAVQKSTVRVPMEAWATKYIGTVSGRLFFTDPGGNQNDPEMESNPNLPAQTLFSMAGTGFRYLPTRMRLPIAGLTWNQSLLIVQKNGMGAPQSNAAIVDPSTGTAKFLFSSARNELSQVALLPVRGYAVFTERGASQVLLYDLNSRQLISSAKTSGADPRGLTTFGHCALTANFEDRTIDVISFKEPATPQLVGTLETTLPASEFARMSQVAADDETGMVFGRSNFPCNPMAQVCDQDWNRVVSFGDETRQMMLNHCR
jgi:hypothetical protein